MDAGARFDRISFDGVSMLLGDRCAALARAIAALLWMSALALVARRMAGALVQPLNIGPLLAATAVFVLAAAGARLAWLRSDVDMKSVPMAVRQAALSAAVLLFAGATTLPGSSLVALMIVWITAIAGEAFGWTASWRRRNIRSSRAPSTPLRRRLHSGTGKNVEQQLVYTRGRAGDVEVHGVILVSFEAGQRTATSHVAFCPPLASAPAIEFSQTAGPSARTRLGMVLPWGVRFDLKLDQASAAACGVRLEFRAHRGSISPSTVATGRDGNAPPSGTFDRGR